MGFDRPFKKDIGKLEAICTKHLYIKIEIWVYMFLFFKSRDFYCRQMLVQLGRAYFKECVTFNDRLTTLKQINSMSKKKFHLTQIHFFIEACASFLRSIGVCREACAFPLTSVS